MQTRTLLVISLLCSTGAAFAACSDSATTVAVHDAGSADASAGDAGASDSGYAACGAVIPPDYDGSGFEANAAAELSLRSALDALLKPMKDFEAAQIADAGAPSPVLAADLKAKFEAGNPSLSAVAPPEYRTLIEGFIAAYEPASGAGAYTPVAPPPADGGVIKDLKGEKAWVVDANGLDLRQAIEKGLYNAAFFVHALGITASGQSVTPATVDRLVASFGAHPSFQNNQSAPANKDVNAASYAARRDTKDPNRPGVYLRAKQALITAQATAKAGDKCGADRDKAIADFFLEWEKSQYATVVYYANNMVEKLSVGTVDQGSVLHAYGEVFGFVAGFRGAEPARRKIQTAEIDALLSKLYAAVPGPVEGFKIVTENPVSVIGNLNAVMADIQKIYGFSAEEMDHFKVNR